MIVRNVMSVLQVADAIRANLEQEMGGYQEELAKQEQVSESCFCLLFTLSACSSSTHDSSRNLSANMAGWRQRAGCADCCLACRLQQQVMLY
jgi:hypothetical protein